MAKYRVTNTEFEGNLHPSTGELMIGRGITAGILSPTARSVLGVEEIVRKATVERYRGSQDCSIVSDPDGTWRATFVSHDDALYYAGMVYGPVFEVIGC